MLERFKPTILISSQQYLLHGFIDSFLFDAASWRRKQEPFHGDLNLTLPHTAIRFDLCFLICIFYSNAWVHRYYRGSVIRAACHPARSVFDCFRDEFSHDALSLQLEGCSQESMHALTISTKQIGDLDSKGARVRPARRQIWLRHLG